VGGVVGDTREASHQRENSTPEWNMRRGKEGME
jgi:hypothetical protein